MADFTYTSDGIIKVLDNDSTITSDGIVKVLANDSGFTTDAKVSGQKDITADAIVQVEARATFAGFADLVYFESPSTGVVDVVDSRASTPFPVAREEHTLTIPAGSEISSPVRTNMVLKLITADVPSLEGQTLLIQIFDEIGAKVFESSALSESGKRVATVSEVPLAGLNTLNLKTSGSLTNPVTVTTILYGI